MTTTLYRPTGPKELALVATGYRRWPPPDAEELELFNDHIVGLIDVVASF